MPESRPHSHSTLVRRSRGAARRARSTLGLAAATLLLAGPASTADKKKDGLPLEDSENLRSFSLETDEVTWLSASLTPDDAYAVVDILGDLYRIPTSGGAAERLTEGMGFDSQPSVSHDGELIAFTSDRDGAQNLWVMPLEPDADGARTPRKLSKATAGSFTSPSWSADAQYVYVSTMGKGKRTYEIFAFHRNGGSGVQVTTAAAGPDTPRSQQHNALGAVASPDGKYLYYARRNGGFAYNLDFPAWQIARRDLDTGDEDVLTAAQGSAVRPALSPDGKLLTYATRLDNQTGIKVRDLETGDERWLAYPVQRDEQESLFSRDLYPGYAFTSDGSELIVSWGGKLKRVNVLSGDVADIPFTAQIDQKLAPLLDFPRRVEEGPVRARTVQGAVSSPTSDTVAFSALTRLFVTDGDGTSRQISAEGQRAFQPAWSPDGASVAYVTWERDGGHVWRVPAAGGTPQQLTNRPAFYAQPVWAPDGETIVSLRGGRHARLEMPGEFGRSPLQLDLVEIPSTGGAARLIAPSRGVATPHFGPEPDRIYVVSGQGLISMKLDGTDRRTHLEVKGPGFYSASEPVSAQEIQIHPGGGWAIARVSNRFYVVAVPRVGKAPVVNIDSPSVPVKQLSDLGADLMHWADGGDTIAWAVGAAFYSTPLADLDWEPKTPGDGESTGDSADDASEDSEEAEEEADGPDFPEATRIDLVAELPRAEPSGTVLLTGGRVVTMNGDEVFERGDVLVRGRRIEAVGASGSLDVPEGTRRIDTSGKTVLPGFVDTHAHWTEIRRRVLDVESWPFLASLAWGVTTGLDVQTMSNDMFAYQDLIDAGEVLGPRAYSTGPGVFSDNDFKTKAQAEGVLRRYRDHYGARNLKAYLTGNRKQRQLLAQAAYELEMMPTTEGGLDMEMDLTHAIDGFTGNEHSLPVVPLYKDVVELYAEGTSYTPTLLVAYGGPWAENAFFTRDAPHDDARLRRFMPHDLIDGVSRKRIWFRPDEHVFPMLAESAGRIHRAGGRVGVGAHGQLQGLGYHWEMESLAAGGMTPREVLYAATLGGARIIGLAQDLGSITPGKIADLVVLGGNPLDDIRLTNTVEHVMKNGELYEAETLDQVYPEEKPLPAQWWWSAWPGVEVGAGN